MSISKNWQYAAFLSGFIGLLGITLYPIAISPMIDASKYKKIQSETRKHINKEDIQPGNMKVWTDPFGRQNPENK